MSVVLKPIFEWIVDQWSFFDNPLLNLLTAAIVGEIAYRVAYAYVGGKYASGDINGKTAGSVLHWVARLVIYAAITALIWVVRFMISIPWWAWVIIGSTLVVIIIVIAVLHIAKKRKRSQRKPTGDCIV